jgi:hypothetical protein
MMEQTNSPGTRRCGTCLRWERNGDQGGHCDLHGIQPPAIQGRIFPAPWPKTPTEYGPCAYWLRRKEVTV